MIPGASAPRRKGGIRHMRSFKDIDDNNIQFEDIQDLSPETSEDIETDEITAWYIYIGDHPYEVSESTYNKICELKHIR